MIPEQEESNSWSRNSIDFFDFVQRVLDQTKIFMYSFVMNAVIKLLLSKGNKINCLKRGRPPEKAVTEVLAQVLGFSMVNFCLSIRLWEVTFVRQRFL